MLTYSRTQELVKKYPDIGVMISCFLQDLRFVVKMKIIFLILVSAILCNNDYEVESSVIDPPIHIQGNEAPAQYI